MLLDTNIVIYAIQRDQAPLRKKLRALKYAVSAISEVEALGYHLIQTMDRELLETFFDNTLVLPIDDPVIKQAVLLKQQRKMKLGDSIIPGTALVHDLELFTLNTQDFSWIAGLTVTDKI